jgi:hypothetical protein
MSQNETVDSIITVNPIYENTVFIDNAVLTNIEFVDAVLINDSSNICMIVNHIISCLVTILCLSFALFVLFLCTGGIGYFLTMYSGDDTP